jgi:enamidase
MDAPMGAVGDVPDVGMVLVDGKIVLNKSRNTPPPKRIPSVSK